MRKSIPSFQFQSGAIKASGWDDDISDDFEFQFQSGAIKAGGAGLWVALSIYGFNSNLVRLRRRASQCVSN